MFVNKNLQTCFVPFVEYHFKNISIYFQFDCASLVLYLFFSGFSDFPQGTMAHKSYQNYREK